MSHLKYTLWQDGEFFVGYLNEYPNYWTQGHSKDELVENIKDLLVDVESGQVPFIRKVEGNGSRIMKRAAPKCGRERIVHEYSLQGRTKKRR
jgi:hypothetical protein